MSVGTFLMAGGLLIASATSSIWHLYLTFGLLSGFGMGALYAPGTGTVSKFFIKKRGLALGIAISGAGIGPFVFLPLIQKLVQVGNWRTGFIVLGMCLLIGGFLPLFILKGKGLPEDMGLVPDGDGSTKITGDFDREKDLSLGRAMKTKEFWLWLFIYAFTALAIDGILLTHLPAHLTDIGFTGKVSAFAAGIVLLTFALGAIFMGLMGDRVDRRHVLKLSFLLAFLAVFLLMGINKNNHLGLYFVVILIGFTLGAIYPTFIGLAGDLFGRGAMATISGVGTLGLGIAAFIGSWLGGYFYDTTQSYRPAFWTVLFCLALAGFLTFFMKKNLHPGD
jgi:MFS family permease